eukprot:CAMPEP_0119057166 /NCGR_PEP_ID=MMETSP1178-20130426/1687_1 /TAXON_ID=33656 /ORGANISM="unid sp, Strain CCMP2000" /LENGTH=100 /DNA_ID=CAMNT_0007037969 /DNA_START=61 /DNA_END=362 /DNA_ORIENTATION=-
MSEQWSNTFGMEFPLPAGPGSAPDRLTDPAETLGQQAHDSDPVFTSQNEVHDSLPGEDEERAKDLSTNDSDFTPLMYKKESSPTQLAWFAVLSENIQERS